MRIPDNPVLIAALAGACLIQSMPVQGAIQTFNSPDHAQSATYRDNWLAAIGIASPQYLVDFETGFVDNQNISGLAGLFPGGLVITDTSADHKAIIQTGSGSISNSNPVGAFSLIQNEDPYLVLDFSAKPVDYVGFRDIDQAHTDVIVTLVDGTTFEADLDTTAGNGDSAEFYGLFRNDQARIRLIQLDASGDVWWGIDNIEYGVHPIPEPEVWGLMLAGLGLVGWVSRSRRRATNQLE